MRSGNRLHQQMSWLAGGLILLAACGGDTAPADDADAGRTDSPLAAPNTTGAPSGTEDGGPPPVDAPPPTTTTTVLATTTTEPPPELVDPDELVNAVVAASPLFGEPTPVDDVRCFASESNGLVRVDPAVSLLATARGDIPTTVQAIHEHQMTAEELQAAADALRACFPETFIHPEYGTEVPSYWWTVATVLEAEI